MGNSEVALVVFCHQEELKAITLETARRLGLAHKTVSGCEQIADCVRACSLAILVIWQRQIDDACLSLVRKWSARSEVFSICVSDSITRESARTLIRSGAVSCMSTDEARGALSQTVESIRNSVMAALRSTVTEGKEIALGPGLQLVVPDYRVTDGELQSRVPPIPGKLLECLASSQGGVVPAKVLVEAGWGRFADVKYGALHQQMYVLREVLGIYGASHWIQCRRGVGYALDPTVGESTGKGSRR